MKHQSTLLGVLLLLFSIVLNAQSTSERIQERIQERIESSQQKIQKQKLRFEESGNFFVDRAKMALVDYHHGAYLGIRSNKVSKEKAEKLGFQNPFGSYVSKVLNNTAAKKAGLQPFDYIYGIDDYRTTRQSSLSDLLAEHQPGDAVDLHVIRNGQKKTMKVTLGEWSDEDYDEEDSNAFFGISQIGSNPEDMSGVFVSVVDNSTAKSMGLEKGDKIKSINGHQIVDWDDISTAIDNMTPGENISVVYEREGKEMTGNSSIKSYDDTYDESYLAEREEKWDEKEEKEVKEEKEWKEEKHDYAFLGVNLGDLSKEKAKKLGFETHYGTYVSGIIKGSAADKYGLKPLDYIYGIDEYRVGEEQSLTGILKKYQPGSTGAVKLIRQQKKKSVDVTFGSRDDEYDYEEVETTYCDDPFFGITSASDKDEKGVKVNIVKNSTAKELDMQNGDVILTINDYVMVDWDDIGKAIDMIKPGEKIKVTYLRDGVEKSATAPIKSYAQAKNCESCDCDDDKDYSYNYKYDYDYDYKEKSRNDVDFSNIKIEIGDANSNSFGLTEKGASNDLQLNNLNLEPNEKRGMLNLTFNLPSNGSTVVKVLNAKGRVIYEYDLGQFSGNFEDEIDIIQNGEGSYFLHIQQGSKAAKKTIIVTSD